MFWLGALCSFWSPTRAGSASSPSSSHWLTCWTDYRTPCGRWPPVQPHNTMHSIPYTTMIASIIGLTHLCSCLFSVRVANAELWVSRLQSIVFTFCSSFWSPPASRAGPIAGLEAACPLPSQCSRWIHPMPTTWWGAPGLGSIQCSGSSLWTPLISLAISSCSWSVLVLFSPPYPVAPNF